MTITVRSCSECPFFEQTLGLGLVQIFLPSVRERMGEFPGVCDFPPPGGVRHFPIGTASTPDIDAERTRREQRVRIRNANELPEQCPLRTQDAVVTLGS